MVWDALDHLGILSSPIFVPCPLRWFYSLLSTDLGVRGGGGKAWVVLFCFLHGACKVVSELTGWNWELLWSLVSISQPLKSKEREGTSAFHGFSANINKVTFLGSSRSKRSVLTKNDLLSEFLKIQAWNRGKWMLCLTPDLFLYQASWRICSLWLQAHKTGIGEMSFLIKIRWVSWSVDELPGLSPRVHKPVCGDSCSLKGARTHYSFYSQIIWG